MSDEEDEDLAFLRSAALASIKKKHQDENHKESEDLETLRKMALSSRKYHNEKGDPILKQLQPIRSSNLINLTPNPSGETTSEKSDSEEEDFRSKTSSSNKSESEKSSSSSEDESSPSKGTKADQISAVSEKKTEEDDLLSAIDQFLDEGVMMLEQVTDTSPPPKDAKAKKVKEEKPKKKKKTKTIKQSKSAKVEPQTKPKKKVEKSVPKPVPPPPVKERVEKEKQKRSRTTQNPQVQQAQTHKEAKQSSPVAWPTVETLNEKAKQNEDSDSVHSSDLSFLSSSDNEEYQKDLDHPVPYKPERKFIRISQRKLNELKKENSEARRFGREEVSEREKREDERNQLPRVSRPDRKLPDLRDKLKRRGLLRRTRHDGTKDEKSKEVRSKKEENGSSKVSKKIYVKPNVVFNDSSINKPHEKPKAELPRAFTDRLTVRRKVTEGGFSPLKIRLTDGDEKRRINNFRRKRSVVQYKPEESQSDKQKRLEEIKKKAQEAKEIESLSDLSEDFGDFEFEEPQNISFVDEDEKIEKIPNTKKPVPKNRIASSTAPPPKKEQEDDSSLSDYDEEADGEAGEIKNTPPRKSSTSEDSEVEKAFQIRSKVKTSKNSSRIDKTTKKRASTFPNEPMARRERPLPPRSQASDRNRWRRDRIHREYDDDDIVLKRTFYEDDREREPYKRGKRKNDQENAEISDKRSVKHRLGVNKPEPRAYPKKRLDSREYTRKTADREKDVDARIQRIQEQNIKLKKRRLQIEQEEREYR